MAFFYFQAAARVLQRFQTKPNKTTIARLWDEVFIQISAINY